MDERDASLIAEIHKTIAVLEESTVSRPYLRRSERVEMKKLFERLLKTMGNKTNEESENKDPQELAFVDEKDSYPPQEKIELLMARIIPKTPCAVCMRERSEESSVLDVNQKMQVLLTKVDPYLPDVTLVDRNSVPVGEIALSESIENGLEIRDFLTNALEMFPLVWIRTKDQDSLFDIWTQEFEWRVRGILEEGDVGVQMIEMLSSFWSALYPPGKFDVLRELSLPSAVYVELEDGNKSVVIAYDPLTLIFSKDHLLVDFESSQSEEKYIEYPDPMTSESWGKIVSENLYAALHSQ